MLDNFFGSRPRLDSDCVAEIKRWATEIFHLPEDTSVMVTELRCTEPGCPPSGNRHRHPRHAGEAAPAQDPQGTPRGDARRCGASRLWALFLFLEPLTTRLILKENATWLRKANESRSPS